MKTMLVLAKQSAFASAIRAVLDAQNIRLLAYAEVWEAESLLRQGFIDACVVDADLTNIQPIRLVEQIQRLAPQCPILIYATAKQWEWEEEAYLLGVRHILAKPVRGRLLSKLLERLWTVTVPAEPPTPPAPPPEHKAGEAAPDLCKTLEILHDFSRILSHCLSSELLLKEFLLLLREIIGVNRAAIFLRLPASSWPPITTGPGDQRLHVACAMGIPSELLEHFELSLEAGIGGYVFRQSRILKSSSEESSRNREVQKEFELLGAQVAIPILDRETFIGVAVFDDRLTGEPFTNEELSLIFHLLEQLGLAIKNSWLHDHLVANHEIMTDILSELGSGIMVIGRNLEVLHANRAARQIFGRKEECPPELEFTDLPQVLAGKVFEAVNHGQNLPPFTYERRSEPPLIYEVRISAFPQKTAKGPYTVLLLIEDITVSERARHLEIESSNLQLIRRIAEQLAHEIGNSVVPLSVHQQLLTQKYGDAEFRDSLEQVMADGVKRITRLSSQMVYLACEDFPKREGLLINRLMEDAFTDAKANFPDRSARLQMENAKATATLHGDFEALKHAFSEILLNALQARPTDPQARVIFRWDNRENAVTRVHIEVQDAGVGFSETDQQQAFEPFYTTRSVGLGLGLTVARKIIQAHQGTLEIIALPEVDHGVLRVSLPLSGAPTGTTPRRELCPQPK